MEFTNNIGALREARGWSRPQLGKRMGTSAQQVERLEKGQRKLSQAWIEKAAEALGVQPMDIITPGRTGAAALPALAAASGFDGSVALRQLDLGFAMGDGTNLDDVVDEESILFDPALLRSITRSPPERLLVARGIGDSMFPTLLTDDMVVIDTGQATLNQQDRIWACSIHGLGALKRLRLTGPNAVQIISDNPAIENYEVEAAAIRIIGRLVWSARKH